MTSDLGVASFSSDCQQGGAGQLDRRKTTMPSNFKKLVHERRAKTGETYQAAARHVRAQAGIPETPIVRSLPSHPRVELDPNYYDESQTWFPLRRDGLWLDELDWKRNLLGLRQRSAGTRALAALKRVFPPEWSCLQSGTKGLHPVVYDALTIGGRHRLLEVGAMLSSVNISRRLRERLLLAEEYHGVCAELHVGLLIKATGARYETEPVNDGIGPDGRAQWESGSLAIEVKRPHQSVQARATQQVELDFFNEFSRAITAPPLDFDIGVWLSLHVKAGEWPRTATGAPDSARIRGLARDAAATVRARLQLPTRPDQFAAGPGVDVNIQLGLADEPRVQLGMYSHRDDHDHEAKRLFSTVREAAMQLSAIRDVPGLIVLDADADLGILNHVDELETMLHEAWAQGLAGVAIVTKDSSADEEIGDARLDTAIRIVPGPLAGSLSNTLIPELRLCERGHLHIDPLLRPGKTCRAIQAAPGRPSVSTGVNTTPRA